MKTKHSPNLVIAGPPKSGTTSLHKWLSAHPSSCASSIKEPHYFIDEVVDRNREANYLTHGLKNYKQFFKNCNETTVRFESTPSYIHSENAIKGLAELNPRPTILFLYRDPVERMWSEFIFNKYVLRKVHQPLNEYLGENLESRVVRNGRTVTLINEWVKLWGKKRILCYSFSALQRPRELMRHICGQLQVDPDFYDLFDFSLHNKSERIRSKGLRDWGKSIEQHVPGLSQTLRWMNNRFNKSRIPDPTEEEMTLLEKLRLVYSNELPENLACELHLHT